jgi:serine phosphatase RsbU (regulator of sigma subunit)
MRFRSTDKAPWIVRYGIALLLVGLALALTIVVSPFREHGHFLLFFAAVTVSQIYGGLGTGILATVLSVLAVDFFLVPPIYEFDISWDRVVGSGAFVVLILAIDRVQARANRLHRVVAQTEEQFRLAKQIQQKLFPDGAPRLAGFDISGACHPAEAIGGDYFDFIPMSGGRVGVAVGDVSSHGFGPALLMAEVHASIRALALAHIDVGEMLTLANRIACEDMADGQFVTVFLGCLDPHERTFVYASAGHQGFLLDGCGKMTKLASTGRPLGVEPTEIIQCAPAIHLDDGCFVLLITDGIFEAKSIGGSSFGIERAFDIVRKNRDLPAERIVHQLCQAVRVFSQNGPQCDDMTAVVIKTRPSAVPVGSTREKPHSVQEQGRTNG